MSEYIINGPDSDLKRLDVLSKTYDNKSIELLRRAGLRKGMKVLELGCGSGSLAANVAQNILEGQGLIIALDKNRERLDAAEKKSSSVNNINFRLADIQVDLFPEDCDLVYTRSTLCHLDQSTLVIKKMLAALKTGGIVVIEEPDMSGIVHYPYNQSMEEGQKLFNVCVKLQRADINIGYKIPGVLKNFGVKDIEISVYQPCFLKGELKCTLHKVLRNSADSILKYNLIDKEKLEYLIREIELYIADENTFVTRPRFFQVYGKK